MSLKTKIVQVKKSGILGSAIVLSILAVLGAQIFSLIYSSVTGKEVLVLTPAILMILVLLLVLLPFKFLFEGDLNRPSQIFTVILAVGLTVLMMIILGKIIPNILSNSFSLLQQKAMSVLT